MASSIKSNDLFRHLQSILAINEMARVTSPIKAATQQSHANVQ